MFLLDVFRRIKPFLWLLPGFLLYAAFPPMAEKMDVLFALAPLMWLSRRGDAKTSARRWFVAGGVFWFATLSWMPAIVKNGGPWPLVVLGWGALAAYCALYFGLYGWLSAKYWQWAKSTPAPSSYTYLFRLLGIFLVEPILWCGLELVRSRFLGGFAWNQLGVAVANAGFGAPAALGGVYLLSAVVILVNGSIAGIVERVWKPSESGWSQLRRWGSLETVGAFAAVFMVYWLAGGSVGRVDRTGTVAGDATSLKVALIQRNFPCVFQEKEENPYEVYEKLVASPAALKPDLVVLPESAMCEFGAVDGYSAKRFAKWLSEKCGGAAVLAGGSRKDNRGLYNSAALYEFKQEKTTIGNQIETVNSEPGTRNLELRTSVYDKVHLVPFGEFIPGDKWFPALQKLAPVGSCTPGEEKLLELQRADAESLPCRKEDAHHGPPPPNLSTSADSMRRACMLGLAICFEDTDSALMRRFAAKGAQMLVFITNDSWFSHSVEAEQHAWQSVLRSVETGLPVVRVGNSGVTGTITPDGRAAWLQGSDGRPLVDRRAAMFDRIESSDGRSLTVYVRLGDVPLGISFALLLAAFALGANKNCHVDLPVHKVKVKGEGEQWCLFFQMTLHRLERISSVLSVCRRQSERSEARQGCPTPQIRRNSAVHLHLSPSPYLTLLMHTPSPSRPRKPVGADGVSLIYFKPIFYKP